MPPFDADSQTQTALQGLGTLSSALFPNPAAMAQGYYYGALARKAQIEGYKDIDAMNANNNLSMGIDATSGQGPAPAPKTYSTVMLPGGTPLNIMNSPTNLPGVGAPAPAAAPTAPPASAAAAVMPTSGQVAQAAANTSAAVAPAMYGQAPPGGASPAPGAGAPAAPTTTGSNGTVPTNQYGEGTIHPASVNPTPGQGGTLQAPPAGQNGSIAGTQFNLLNFVNLSQRAGRDAASSMAIGRAYLGQLLNQNQISQGEYDRQLASVGEPGPYQTNKTVAGEYARQGLANQGALAVTQQQGANALAERNLIGQQTFTFVPDPANPGQGKYLNAPAMQAAGASGTGVPAASQQVAGDLVAVKPYLNDKGQIENLNPVQAGKRTDITPLPDRVDQGTAQQFAKIMAMPDGPDKRQAIANFRSMQGANAYDPDKQAKQNAFDYSQLQNIYARRNTGWIGQHLEVQSPAYFDRPAEDAVQARLKKIVTTDSYYQQRPDLAYQRAVNQLIAEGVIESPDQVNNAREAVKNNIKTLGAQGDPRVMQANNPFAGTVQPHMTIHLLKPSPDQPSAGAVVTTPPGQVPTVEGAPVTNAAPTSGPGPVPTPAPTASAATSATTPTITSQQPTPSVAPIPRMLPRQPAPQPVAPAPPRPPHMRGMTTPTNTDASLGATVAPAVPVVAPAAQPAAAAAAPAAVPAARPGAALPAAGALQTSAPAGALAPAPNVPDMTYVTLADGTQGIVKGGWVYRR